VAQSVNSQFIHTHPMAQLYSSQRPRAVNRNREKKKGYSLVSDDRTEWDERSHEVWTVEMNGRSGRGEQMRAGRRGTATHTAELPTVCQRDESELRLPSGDTEMYTTESCVSVSTRPRGDTYQSRTGEQAICVILYDAPFRVRARSVILTQWRRCGHLREYTCEHEGWHLIEQCYMRAYPPCLTIPKPTPWNEITHLCEGKTKPYPVC
jgi:hypothetical protein